MTRLFSERHHLRPRGWSARLIRDLLGAPDETRGHYRGTVRLWREDRVVEAETHPAFLNYQREHNTRSAALRKGWTVEELDRLRQMAPTQSDAEIATCLGRTRGAVAAMKFRLGLELDAGSKSRLMRKVRAKARDAWTPEQDAIIQQRRENALAEELLPLINRVGPPRTAKAIRGKRNTSGVTVSEELRSRISKSAQSRVNHNDRLTVPFETKWRDLLNIVRQIFLGSMLGDGGLYRRGHGRYYYYAETHGIAQEDYLAWKRGLVGEGFRSGLCHIIDRRKGRTVKKPSWTTPSHPIFTELRLQFYATEFGDKSVISDVVMEELDEVGLMIWYLDDGSAGISSGRPYPSISAPGWKRECLDKFCEKVNPRLGTRLYVWPRQPRPHTENRIILDRDRLVPIWRDIARQYYLPVSMLISFQTTYLRISVVN
jgi:LAGLIDADG DNA endonuclease family